MSEVGEDTRIAFYEAARAETLLRIQQRDICIFTFVAVLGAYFGFVVAEQLSKPPSTDLLLTETITALGLPVICACFMLIYQQHHMIIAVLERYMKKDLFPNTTPPHLNNSPSLARVRGLAHDVGFFAQSGLIAAPLLYACVYWKRNHAIDAPNLGLNTLAEERMVDAVTAFMLASLCVVAAVAIYSYFRRATLRA